VSEADDFMTVVEVASILKVNQQTVRNRLNQGSSRRGSADSRFGLVVTARAHQSELLVSHDDAEEKRLKQRRSRGSRPPLPLQQYFKPFRAETS
jgi:hypothetical protein